MKYILKEDSQPYPWGKQTLHHMKETVKAQGTHRKMPERNKEIVKKEKISMNGNKFLRSPGYSETNLLFL